eukprot:CFRG6956T1
MASRAPDKDQPKLLEEARQVVKVQAFQMKRCLEKNRVMDALKHASTLSSELKTSNLSPKNYYELYMAVIDELRHLELHLEEEFTIAQKVAELYELVQYAANIIPRLYLLIVVGTVYVKVAPNMRKEIVLDLVEMCRGVQHPLRGLFLRNYLLQQVKNLLPDCTTAEVDGFGTVHDSIDFILANFGEMNKLWVRMQHQGHSRDREKRERERKDLRLLVGTNLVRLSQLENVDIKLYNKVILPGFMDQIVNCRDAIAQEYLMECIIQVFPDDFHLRSLHVFLDGCAALQPNVNAKTILNSLIDRLATYALTEGAQVPADVQLFDIFSAHVSDLINARQSMTPADIVSLQVSLAQLALKCFPDNLEYINKTFDYCGQVLANRNIQCVDVDVACSKELMKLAKIPCDTYDSVLMILQLTNYGPLLQLFGFANRKALAVHIVKKMIEKGEIVEFATEIDALLDLINPLMVDQEDQPIKTEDLNSDFAFIGEQTLVARLFHNFFSEEADQQYQILVTTRKHCGSGGEVRIQHTLPTLVFGALKLIRRYNNLQDEDDKWSKKIQKLFQYAHQTITALGNAGHETLALSLALQCTALADSLNLETIAYEFFTKALLVYEEDINESRAQFNAILLMTGSLEQSSCFAEENYDTLSTKCALHSSKLLKKPDQSRAVIACSHLFWSGTTSESDGEKHEGKRVLECLQKGLKIADSCMEPATNVQLFIEILDRYIYFFDHQNPFVTTKYLSGLIDLVHGNLDSVDDEDAHTHLQNHFTNSLDFLRQQKEGCVHEGYEALEL